jgi:hypothetical protein
VRSKRDERE